VLGYLIIFLGALVALIKLLDVLMSDQQKTGLSDAIASSWNLIDDRKNDIRDIRSSAPSIIEIFPYFLFALLIGGFGLALIGVGFIIETPILNFIIFGIGFLILVVVVLPLYVLWYVILLIIFLAIITPIVWVLELVIRRIVEWPKGPLFSISAICGALGTLLKVFT
jgi:hypothetical protein